MCAGRQRGSSAPAQLIKPRTSAIEEAKPVGNQSIEELYRGSVDVQVGLSALVAVVTVAGGAKLQPGAASSEDLEDCPSLTKRQELVTETG